MSEPVASVDLRPPLSLARHIEFRPLALPACAFIAGILLREYLGAFTTAALVAAIALVALVPVVFFLTRRAFALHALVIVLCACCGFLRQAWEQAGPAPDDVSRFVGAQGALSMDAGSRRVGSALLRVRGVIAARPKKTVIPADGVFQPREYLSTQFPLDVDGVETHDGWQRASGTVDILVFDNASDFASGDRIEALAKMSRFAGPTSAGQFDARLRREREGVRVRGTLDSRLELGMPIAHNQGSFVLEVAHSIGRRLASVIDRTHDPREAGLLRCILLGERSAVDPEINRNFRQAGLSDLLAVSGLHVVILFGGLWIVLRFFFVSERRIAWIVLVGALLYAAMAEFGPSVSRAFVVIAMFSGGVILGRRHDMVNSLAAATLLLLVINPNTVFFAGFQLSFIAVLGLVGLAPVLERFLKPRLGFSGLDLVPGAHHWLRVKANGFFVTTLAITAAAWLASQPLVAWHFQIINPATILLNLLLVPIFGVILLGGFLALIVEMLGVPMISVAAAWVSGSMAWVLDAFSESAARFPGSWVHFPSPPAWALVVYYALLALVALGPSIRLRRRYPAAALLVLIALLIGREALPARPDSAQLIVLDVGQGSAALVRSPEGHSALIDIGSVSVRPPRDVVIPYLVRSRVRALDALILTHSDSDHVSGLPTLLNEFRVSKVFLSETFKYTSEGLSVERYLIERGVPCEFVGAGDSIALGSLRLDILHPPRSEGLLDEWFRKPDARRRKIDENERSAVVRGVTADGAFVVFGDVSGAGVERLRSVGGLDADVVVAPHHGGTSGGETLAGQYHWPLVLFSARRDFAKPKLLETYQSAGSRTLITADTGTITVRFAKTIEVSTFRK